MADTQPLAPTDAEIHALWRECDQPTDQNGHITGPLPFARATIAKWGAQPVVPAGYALVPVEPTPEMLAEVDEEVGGHCYSCTRWKASYDDCQRIWAAMLAAAPQPVAREPLTDEQIRELWSTRSLHALEFARAIESAHGITTNGRKDAP